RALWPGRRGLPSDHHTRAAKRLANRRRIRGRKRDFRSSGKRPVSKVLPILATPAKISAVKDALGIIAGNGEFPLILAREARQPIMAVAFEGETNPDISKLID